MQYSVGWGLSTGGFLTGNYSQEVTLGRKTQAGSSSFLSIAGTGRKQDGAFPHRLSP